MLYTLKNLWRRKTRTILTILGIVVGIIALTVLSSLAARMNQQVNGNISWYMDGVSVTPGEIGMHGRSRGYFELSKAGEVEAVPGVKKVNISLTVPAETKGESNFTSIAEGLDLNRPDSRVNSLKLASGRHLKAGDRRKAVLGSNFSQRLDVDTGQKVDINTIEFEVVGILEATLGAPDRIAFISIDDARDILALYMPDSKIGNIANSIRAFPDKKTSPEKLAKSINKRVKGVETTTPEEMEKEIAQFTFIFNAIILGVALIALIVGGLSVINTMVMSVSERTREIGVKKALGADTSAILGEIMAESGLIGFLGGLFGVLLGVLIILPLNSLSMRNDVSVFVITPYVIIGPILFASVLGIVAGFFPALRASRLDPVDALRED